ncbi:MAG: hypothetical protein ACE5JM_12265 [Armatimonadota bacterium]
MCPHVAFLAILLPAASPLPTAEVSASKLSLHLIAHYTPAAREVVRAGPRVLKVLDLGPDMLEAMREYKTRFPGGATVVRIYTVRGYEVRTDPEAAGRDWWENVLAPAVAKLSPEDRRLIDYLEGPNEGEHYPVWESPEHARWFARFWQTLAPLIARAGFKPCIGSIPVGNPPATPEEIEESFLAFAPALRAAHRLGGAWSYHAYSLAYTTDLDKELWTSLRYRMLHDAATRRWPDLADMPVILTEAGADRLGNPQQDGWQARGDAARFQQWLKWFDARLQEDDYVLGATLFQSGDARGWPSFDTEPINAWLAQYLRRPRID